MNLKEATKKLTELIRRLEREQRSAGHTRAVGTVKTYPVNSDLVSFWTQDLGGLMLTDDDAKEYRQCVGAIHAQASGKTEHISRSAIESFIQGAILRALDPLATDTEKDFEKRLDSALGHLTEELKAEPSIWETHLPVQGLATDKLPSTFGRCEFYFGDEPFLNELMERIGRVVLPDVGEGAAQVGKRFIRERIQKLVRGQTWVFTLANAVDGRAARLIARKRVRQTVDILNFYANLGGRPPCQVLLAEDPRPGILNTFLFSENPPAFEPPSERVGPIVAFSFASPDLEQAGLERMSEMLKKQPPSEFEDRVISAFQWAGKASVEPRKEEAFLLFAISLESLLMERQDKAEITETLSLRAAHVIAAPQSRLTVYQDMKKLYGIRSKIVHSGSVDVGDDQLSEIRYYARLALLTMLCAPQFSGITNDKELTEWFRARLLDTPQSE
ncbi:MAG: hypothetical protein ABSD64_02020 [Terriglobales bacterium]